ncbi:MAG: DNA double-strand break repair nuclease NurA [Anaerolineales bacterium]|nr:DNA double-strand break repair nuclease NurA [Anaerolineales bacterium]
MTLKIIQLLNDIDNAVGVIVERRAEYRDLVKLALEKLAAYSDNLEDIAAKVAVARKKLSGDWRGAVPAGEPLASTFDPPHVLEPVCHIIAADGSQIFPDRHGIAHYALIHIGALHYQPDSNLTPIEERFPDLIFGDRLVEDERDETLLAADISRIRDQRELETLISFSAGKDGPVVSLLDSPLHLWILGQKDTSQEIERWFLEQLERAKKAGLILAGYVDRPGSYGVTDLLALADLPVENIAREEAALNLFKGLPDRFLFEVLLKPGQRSAFFYNDSPFNKNHAGQKIGFFYINAGKLDEPVIARVETPCWVADEPTRLDQLHAAIWDQCQIVPGYPYVLARAHEIAVVTQENRREVENLIGGTMLQHGLMPKISAKAEFKSYTG